MTANIEYVEKCLHDYILEDFQARGLSVELEAVSDITAAVLQFMDMYLDSCCEVAREFDVDVCDGVTQLVNMRN